MLATKHQRTSHDNCVKRLKTAERHLRNVLLRIEAGPPYLETAQQLHAVEKAVTRAKEILIRDHLDHCLEGMVGSLVLERRRADRRLQGNHQIFLG